MPRCAGSWVGDGSCVVQARLPTQPHFASCSRPGQRPPAVSVVLTMLQRRPALQPRPATRSAALPCNPGPPPAAQPCPATHAPARSAPCPPAWPARPACPAPGPRWRRSEQQLAARPRMPSTPSLLPYWPTCTHGCGWGGRQASWASVGWQGLLSCPHIPLRAKVCQADSPVPVHRSDPAGLASRPPPTLPSKLGQQPKPQGQQPSPPSPRTASAACTAPQGSTLAPVSW